MAKAQGLSSAVGQGAQFSSGAAGGQAQASADNAFNQEGISQNLQIGNNIFGLQNKVSGYQMQMAQLQGQAATYQGIGSIGNMLAGNAGPLGNMLGNIFGNSGSNPGSGGPSYYQPGGYGFVG